MHALLCAHLVLRPLLTSSSVSRPPPTCCTTATRATQGIKTDVLLSNVKVADNKHAGMLILRDGSFTERAQVTMEGGVIAGQSSAKTCGICTSLGQSGCHPNPSPVSYNRAMPFTASVGLVSASFAQKWSPGPDVKPWDAQMGYPMVHGRMDLNNVTFADFYGSGGCGGAFQTYAMANHPKAVDAAHPHYFTGKSARPAVRRCLLTSAST